MIFFRLSCDEKGCTNEIRGDIDRFTCVKLSVMDAISERIKASKSWHMVVTYNKVHGNGAIKLLCTEHTVRRK